MQSPDQPQTCWVRILILFIFYFFITFSKPLYSTPLVFDVVSDDSLVAYKPQGSSQHVPSSIPFTLLPLPAAPESAF